MEKQTLTTVGDMYRYVKNSSAYHRIDSVPELAQFECEEGVPSWVRSATLNIDGVISFDHLVTFNKSYIDGRDSADVNKLCVRFQFDDTGMSDMMLVARSMNVLRDVIEPFAIESVDVLDTDVLEVVIEVYHAVEQSEFDTPDSIVGIETVS